MKHFILFLLLLGPAGAAHAQLVNLIATGVRLGVGAGIDAHHRAADTASDATVVPATYRGLTYPLKRTPAKRLRGDGGDQIAYQESLLQQCQAQMLADSTATVGNPDLWDLLKGSREVIAGQRPQWNTAAYATEAAFYQAENARRQRQPKTATH